MDRAFRWIKRVNSVLFLLLLIGGSIGAAKLYVAYHDMLASYTARNTPREEVAQPERDPKSDRLVLGEAERVRGTDVTAVVLYSEDKRRSRRNEQMRNILFVSESGARWLLETHSKVLVDFDELRRGEQPTRAFYYVIEAGEEESLAVALSNPDGTKLTEVLSGVTRVLSYEQTSEEALSIIYQADEKLWHAQFDLETFAKLSGRSLVDVPQRM